MPRLLLLAYLLLAVVLAGLLWGQHQRLRKDVDPDEALLRTEIQAARRPAVAAPPDDAARLFDVRLPRPEPEPEPAESSGSGDQPEEMPDQGRYPVPRLMGVFTTERTGFALLAPGPDQRVKARPGDWVEEYLLQDVHPGGVALRAADGQPVTLRIFRRPENPEGSD